MACVPGDDAVPVLFHEGYEEDRCIEGGRRPACSSACAASAVCRICRVRPVLPGSAFTGFRFRREVIVLAARWYLRYGVSYRDVEELLIERGIEDDPSCLVHTLRTHEQCTASDPGQDSG